MHEYSERLKCLECLTLGLLYTRQVWWSRVEPYAPSRRARRSNAPRSRHGHADGSVWPSPVGNPITVPAGHEAATVLGFSTGETLATAPLEVGQSDAKCSFQAVPGSPQQSAAMTPDET